MMEVLVSNPFFVGLPGSARVQLVNTLMTSLAQEAVWSGLSPEGLYSHHEPFVCISVLHKITAVLTAYKMTSLAQEAVWSGLSPKDLRCMHRL